MSTSPVLDKGDGSKQRKKRRDWYVKTKIAYLLIGLIAVSGMTYIVYRQLNPEPAKSSGSNPCTSEVNRPSVMTSQLSCTASALRTGITNEELVSPANPPNDVSEEKLLEKGRLLLMQGRKNEAMDIYSTLINSTTNALHLQMALAKFFIINRDTGNLNGEIAKKERELGANPENVRLMEILAYMYQFSMSAEKEIALRESLSRKTSDSEHLKRLVALYEEENDLPLLAGTYGRLAAANPSAANIYLVKKAETEVEAQRFPAARATCTQLLESKDMDLITRARTALILGSLGAGEDALNLLESCVKEAQSSIERDKYLLELYRVKITLGQHDPSIDQGLAGLATNSASLGVRHGALDLLKRLQ